MVSEPLEVTSETDDDENSELEEVRERDAGTVVAPDGGEYELLLDVAEVSDRPELRDVMPESVALVAEASVVIMPLEMSELVHMYLVDV